MQAVAGFGLLTLAALLSACGGDEPVSLGAAGRSLEIRVFVPQLVDQMSFLDDEGRHRVIRPKASNRQLAVVDVTVVNRTSLVTPLLIDTEAAKLGDRRGERIFPLDPFETAGFADSQEPEEGRFAPLLWGQIPLDRNSQVRGWMVFDVPKGLILGTFWWEEVDDVLVDYINYRQSILGAGPWRPTPRTGGGDILEPPYASAHRT